MPNFPPILPDGRNGRGTLRPPARPGPGLYRTNSDSGSGCTLSWAGQSVANVCGTIRLARRAFTEGLSAPYRPTLLRPAELVNGSLKHVPRSRNPQGVKGNINWMIVVGDNLSVL